MKFISTAGQTDPVSFSKAAFQGLAPDGGLYIPSSWPKISSNFLDQLHSKTLQEIGLEIARLFIDEMDEKTLQKAVNAALNFEAPLVQLDENLFMLELFHGPTLAFKDFGARFMARIFSALQTNHDQDLIILVATSGDTGSAVAQGFLGVEGIQVCLLYPEGNVSRIQEQQLTTAGHNVTAMEVKGTFDDCQRMVKSAFADRELTNRLHLTSANSINIARLLPQSFYYFYAYAQLSEKKAPVFCVPSGNFGNVTAGLMAQKMGLPSKGFIVATNSNDTFPAYWETGDFAPKSSVETISSAMDVGNPSNFARIESLFHQSLPVIQKHIWSTSVTDAQTRQAVKDVFNAYHYIADPHTAVGCVGAKKYLDENPHYFTSTTGPIIVLATAHPAKFANVVEPLIKKEISVPKRLKECLSGKKSTIQIKSEYKKLKTLLISLYQ